MPVQVLSLFQGRTPAVSARWCGDRRRQAALTCLYRDRASASASLPVPALLLRVLRRPASWALTLSCALKARGMLRDALLYAAWLQRHPQQAGVLVCHFGPIGYVGALLRAWGFIDAPQVTVFHGYDMSRELKRRGASFYDRLFRAPRHHSLAITRYWQQRLQRLGDAAASWIPLGVDTASIVFRPRAYPVDAPVRLVTVGRLTGKKGQADVLRALAQLPTAPASRRNWQYHLVGTGPDEALLKAQAQALGLGERVVFHGGLPHADTLALLDACDVFVLTSKTAEDGDMEGLPIALMEALASGMPTLSTCHSGIPELIAHDHNGLLGEEGDIAALRDNLLAILEQPALWERLVAAGRQTVEQGYDLAANTRSFARLLADLAQDRNWQGHGGTDAAARPPVLDELPGLRAQPAAPVTEA